MVLVKLATDVEVLGTEPSTLQKLHKYSLTDLWMETGRGMLVLANSPMNADKQTLRVSRVRASWVRAPVSWAKSKSIVHNLKETSFPLGAGWSSGATVCYHVVSKGTSISKAENPEKQNQEVQTNQWGDEGSNNPTNSGEHRTSSKPNVPERHKKKWKISKFWGGGECKDPVMGQ